MKIDKDYCSKVFKKWKDNLSQEERDVLFEYSDSLYRDINSFLLEEEGKIFSQHYMKKISILDGCLNFNLMGKKSPTSIGGAMNCLIFF